MIKLSDHFTYKRLLRFVLSPILMMIFCSVYSIVDGLFVSNYAKEDAFAALNVVFPFIMILSAVGFMFGSGGTAVVSKTMGEGKQQLANKYFTLIVAVAGSVGVVLAVSGILLLDFILPLLGASGENANLLPLCKTYGTIVLCALPFFMLQNMFHNFFSAAEKTKLGFLFTVASGVANMVLDALFVAVFRWGLTGAAVATAISQFVGGFAPLVYFFCKNNSRLRFTRTAWYGKVVLKSCTNGFSELLGNVSASLVSMLYNRQLLKFAGSDGVNAYGIIMYVQFIFAAIFIGYCIGVMPIVGYNFGAQNKKELQNVFAKSLVLISLFSVAMTLFCIALAKPIANVFVGYNPKLCQMATHGMRLFSVSFLFIGFNMFGSSFFTALNNGLVSAVLSVLRTLVFQVACILLLPVFLQLNGFWLATAVAEGLALAVAVVLTICNNKRYGYIALRKTANT
ncbi:MAG: MATE family efflux transporter [Candidatus Fimimonas sp.]